jgi:hypothetical protein
LVLVEAGLGAGGEEESEITWTGNPAIGCSSLVYYLVSLIAMQEYLRVSTWEGTNLPDIAGRK